MPIADAVLRLATAADGQELLAAEVVDAVAVVGELRADLPRNAAALQNAEVRGELVAPRRQATDVDDLIPREADGRRQRARSRSRRSPCGRSACSSGPCAESRSDVSKPSSSSVLRSGLSCGFPNDDGTRPGCVLIAGARRVQTRRVERAGLRSGCAVRAAQPQVTERAADDAGLLLPERLFADDPRGADLGIVRGGVVLSERAVVVAANRGGEEETVLPRHRLLARTDRPSRWRRSLPSRCSSSCRTPS